MIKRYCTVCNSPIVKNDKVLIISYPIEILDHNYGFDIFGDFFSKLTFVHHECFFARQKDTNTLLQEQYGITSYSKEYPEILRLLYNTLKDLGEQVPKAFLEKFCLEKMSTDLNYLVIEYFKNKTK